MIRTLDSGSEEADADVERVAPVVIAATTDEHLELREQQRPLQATTDADVRRAACEVRAQHRRDTAKRSEGTDVGTHVVLPAGRIAAERLARELETRSEAAVATAQVRTRAVSFDDNDVPVNREDPDDLTAGPKAFHLWEDYGAGEAFKQVTPLVPTPDMGDRPADLSSVLPTMTIDAQSYVWWYGGGTVQGVWRSREPID